MTSENPIPENNPTPNTSGEADKQSDHPKTEVTPTLARPQLPPSHAYCHVTCQQEKNWWDKWKPFVEIGGVILLGVYTGYTIRIYNANHDAAIAAQKTLCEIQKQNTLMRQQVVGSQGAVLIFDPGISVPAIVAAVRPTPGRVTAKMSRFT